MSKLIKRILLVEDELESQLMIDLLLNQYQCQVDVVSDGLAALQKACTLPYDCILMDLGLPKLNGIQTFITIKKILTARSITIPPVIALTEYINHSLIEQCFDLGMASILFKPLKEHHINRLFSRLQQLEQRKKTLTMVSKDWQSGDSMPSLAKPNSKPLEGHNVFY
ncbi:Autoinducer 2 sensor kinase/phosphatase LuxQ [Legionella massiliensis]|uniref:Autoinducer 2 sensor kinase/phosphatase LuxQ n=1 Tax=Legionella massiliensis TaxID=1034943 RepID=A0A078KVY2_9GAMM|nr:response regulator [Legionella massiliensis]CDZ77156.1 Autoinducer 2 sensor kinase/phosphatase LuxQ [Legionella massiliensis]CEE12894.1 Autoinducer 2 sensor kinase/phosphatase LuxQ [Legionella massiliensis]